MPWFFLFILLAAVNQNSYSQNKDIDELTKLNRDWINSYFKKNTSTLEEIFAEDFVLISPRGMKISKSDVINNVKARK